MPERRCAFLRMADASGWSIDADLAFGPLDNLGWYCEWISWRDRDVLWDDWDAVYLAAPWDYPDDPDGFLEVLGSIDRSKAVLLNPLELVRWNIPKTYLADLERRGADIVPSIWPSGFDESMLAEFFDAYAGSAIVMKPTVSTNAANTWVLDRPVDRQTVAELQQTFMDREYVVQRFIQNVRTDGEYSLFYLGGLCSHAIRKVPRRGDFRVQEEHGSTIMAVTPEPRLLDSANRVMSLVRPEPVYGRVDFVRDADGTFRVMELELVEPSLYLRTNAAAPARFARALDMYVRQKLGVKR